MHLMRMHLLRMQEREKYLQVYKISPVQSNLSYKLNLNWNILEKWIAEPTSQ